MEADFRVDSIYVDEELGEMFAQCYDNIYGEEFEKYLGSPDTEEGRQNALTILEDSTYTMTDELRNEFISTFGLDDFGQEVEEEEDFYDDSEDEVVESFSIREALNKIDLYNDNKYDLLNLYESCTLNENEKRELGKLLYDQADSSVIYDTLNKKYISEHYDDCPELYDDLFGKLENMDFVINKTLNLSEDELDGEYIDETLDTLEDFVDEAKSIVDDIKEHKDLNEDLDKETLKSKLEKASREFITNTLGYDDDFVDDYIIVNIREDEFSDGSEAIKCEIRTELDYEECIDLSTHLNPILFAEDKYAYFDMEDAHTLVAYIRTDFSDDIVDEKTVNEFEDLIKDISSMEELRKLYRDIRDSFEDLWTSATFAAVHDLVMDKADELNDNDKVNESKSTNEELYKDVSGVMGEPDETYTEDDLRGYWENAQDDPSISSYKGNFSAWFKDTISQMEEVEELDESKLIKEDTKTTFNQNIDLNDVVTKLSNIFFNKTSHSDTDWIEVYPIDDAKKIENGESFIKLSIESESGSKKASLYTNRGKIDVKFNNGSEAKCNDVDEIARFIAGELKINLEESFDEDDDQMIKEDKISDWDSTDSLGDDMDDKRIGYTVVVFEKKGEYGKTIGTYDNEKEAKEVVDSEYPNAENVVIRKEEARGRFSGPFLKRDNGQWQRYSNKEWVNESVDEFEFDDEFNAYYDGYTEEDKDENSPYNKLKKNVTESKSIKESDEETPYTKEEIERDLKSITHNFTDKEGELKCGFEEEKNFGVEILKQHYKVVETSGDDRRDGTWYHISYANPIIKESNSVDDELETAEQKISSANTSINSSKLPAIFNRVKFVPGELNLDFGGGKFDNATEFLAQQGVESLVYDPYNRTSEHNAEVLARVRENGGADTITLSNVLNVIAEPEARLAVLRNCKRLLKSGGTLYITVYEGTGKGDERETKAGYQLNRKTDGYIDEISSVFSDVTPKGKLIIAK